MNEYSDQDTWYRVERNEGGRWMSVLDVDTREEADDLVARYAESGATHSYRARRVHGLK